MRLNGDSGRVLSTVESRTSRPPASMVGLTALSRPSRSSGEMVGLVHDHQRGGIRAAAGGREGQGGRAVRQAELVRVVPGDGPGLEPRRQPVVHAPQAEREQVHGLVVALREEQHRGGRAEEHLPQGEADGEPGHAELPGLQDHGQAAPRQLAERPHLARPEVKRRPAPGERVVDGAVAGQEERRRLRAGQPQRARRQAARPHPG
jgi:hypothetical protein